MPIYRGLAPLKAYKGDMQPVNVYRGSTKVAGWHLASYSGTSPLTVDCDYNVPPDALTIDGKCVQTGTPSPSSPAPISTITGNVTITGADGAASDTVTVAFGSAVCASLPDGTHDSYDAVTGVLTKRVGKATTSTSDTYVTAMAKARTAVGLSLNTAGVRMEKTRIICSHFPTSESSEHDNIAVSTCRLSDGGTPVWFFGILSEFPTDDALLNWLKSNPVTVYYKLATPTTVQLTPHLPVVRTGIKTLSVGADVVPTLSATVKSMESAITSITQG